MDATLKQIIIGIVIGVVTIGLAKLTTKGAAALAGRVKSLEDNAWTTEEKIDLAERLTKLELGCKDIRAEVDFTKTAHAEFLRLLERAFIPVAHSPHTPEIDELLERRERGEILTVKEWETLINSLGEEAESENAPGKKVALLGLRAIYLTQLRHARKKESSA